MDGRYSQPMKSTGWQRIDQTKPIATQLIEKKKESEDGDLSMFEILHETRTPIENERMVV